MWDITIMLTEKIHIFIRKKKEIKSSTWEETTANILKWSHLGGDWL